MSLQRTSHKRISLVMLPLMFTLTSCSEDIKVDVEANDTGAIFRFGMSSFLSTDLKPICLRMVEVRKSEASTQLWKIVKKGNECTLMKSVILGDSPPDFVEQVDHLPLQPNQNYVVSIIADEGAVTSKPWRR